jgi:nucleotide-binding universal stress UspA family protein
MYQRILVASEASEGGLNAVEAASEIAVSCKAELLALHAYEPPAFFAAVTGGSIINGLACIDPTVFVVA